MVVQVQMLQKEENCMVCVVSQKMCASHNYTERLVTNVRFSLKMLPDSVFEITIFWSNAHRI